jgi:hypothetical protein
MENEREKSYFEQLKQIKQENLLPNHLQSQDSEILSEHNS